MEVENTFYVFYVLKSLWFSVGEVGKKKLQVLFRGCQIMEVENTFYVFPVLKSLWFSVGEVGKKKLQVLFTWLSKN
jgi:hypothetical protein